MTTPKPVESVSAPDVPPANSSGSAIGPPVTAPQSPAQSSGTFHALRHRNFKLYIGGQLVSLAGTWMQIIAQGWLVYDLSKSEAMLGIVGFAAAIPALIIAPWAGVVVDRVSRQRIILWTQIASMILAFVLAGLTFTGAVQVWQVIVLAALLGAVNAFDGPARQAFVVEMVGRGDLPNAIALNSLTFNAARIVGPAFGGLLLATVGAAWCFLFNGLSFLAVIVSLLFIRVQTIHTSRGTQSAWVQLKAGVSYAAHQHELRGLLLLALFFSTFGISYSTVLPAYIDRVLHAGPSVFGLITAASGVGAVVGAFLVATYGDRGFRGRWLFGAALAFPVVLTVFAFTTSLPMALFLAVLLGVGFMTEFTLINTLLQTRVTDQMRGRVMSLYTLTFFGFAPFGNLAVGAAAEVIGLSITLMIAAVITLVSTVAIFWWTPQLKQLP